MMPIAHIKPVAFAQRMVAAWRHPIGPWVFLAARFPLAGNPPAADLDRLCRIGEIEDHDDVADIPFGRRRDVGVAAVEIEPMHAAANGAPLRDQLRRCRIGDIVDVDAAADVCAARLSELLLIDDHDVAGNPHLVRVPAFAHVNLGERFRRCADRRRR